MYQKELNALTKVNRLRHRKIYDETLYDLASNDYLGLANKKKLFKKSYKILKDAPYYGPKSSQLVNGYSSIHKQFETLLSQLNGFEDSLLVGSGFLANISLIEGLVRTKDILFMDEEYHASGIVASKLINNVIFFKHNDYKDLEEKIKKYKAQRYIIAIEGVYSMSGDIAPPDFIKIANLYNALLIVDEAHSSGVIGKNLLGWFDYHNIKIQKNYIKMGTLGKAYGSYGAYILASTHIITFLVNRAKAVIYTTAPSLFDITHAYTNLQYFQKKKEKIRKKINKRQKLVKEILKVDCQSLILPILISDNTKVLELQDILKNKNFLVGAIREPTVKNAILRIILKLDIKIKDLAYLLTEIKQLL